MADPLHERIEVKLKIQGINYKQCKNRLFSASVRKKHAEKVIKVQEELKRIIPNLPNGKFACEYEKDFVLGLLGKG